MTYVWTPGPQYAGLFKPLDQAEFDAMETWAQNHVQEAAGGPVHVDRNLWHPVCVAEIDRLLIERDAEPTDDAIYNRVGVEGGIGYGPDDEPGSLGEHDWRL